VSKNGWKTPSASPCQARPGQTRPGQARPGRPSQARRGQARQLYPVLTGGNQLSQFEKHEFNIVDDDNLYFKLLN